MSFLCSYKHISKISHLDLVTESTHKTRQKTQNVFIQRATLNFQIYLSEWLTEKYVFFMFWMGFQIFSLESLL